ncbi:DUF2000 domain-containing protein [Nocardiopsis composta]|uniref:DUF2000 domain-containing protein n=1 Tax=Nocardiopsis composta TaxID=157465 RepID=A0A7W8VEQ6_9ACTN|nr:DUF2000 domain-containing protein [Nocardiopsis composta]MBB5433572.1 hypothetical protein [Nocardiopsis composta]
MALQTKFVLVVEADAEPAQAVNAAAVTAAAVGGRLPGMVAADGKDASGGVHAGLNPHPIPVLSAGQERLRELYGAARDGGEITAVALNDVARRAREYGEYLDRLEATPAEELSYTAVALFGPKNRVNALTKRLPLYR